MFHFSRFNSDLSELENLSISEVNTHKKWIDGSTIYRKVIDLGNLPNSTVKNVAHNISNLSTITHMEGIAKVTGQWASLPYVNTVAIANGISFAITQAYVQVITSIDYSAYTGYAVLEYTKTE